MLSYTVTETKCRVCKRWVNLDGTRLTSHGPGRNTMFCSGGGTVHLQKGQAMTERRCGTCKWLRKYKMDDGTPDYKCGFPEDRVPYAYRRDNVSRELAFHTPYINNLRWGKDCKQWDPTP